MNVRAGGDLAWGAPSYSDGTIASVAYGSVTRAWQVRIRPRTLRTGSAEGLQAYRTVASVGKR